MTPIEARRLAVLHLLALSGLATQDAISKKTDIPVEEIAEELALADADGLVSERTGWLAGWRLSEDGELELSPGLPGR